MKRKVPGLQRVLKDAFVIDEKGEAQLKDNIESISILITHEGAKVERKFRKEKVNAKEKTDI